MTETTIFLVRHGKHGVDGVPKNMLPNYEEKRAEKVGERLAEMGVKADWAYSSPQPRAYLTCVNILLGMAVDALPCIPTDLAIGDSKLGNHPYSKEVMDYILKGAKATGKGVEEFMLTDEGKNEKLAAYQMYRGMEGAKFIESLVHINPGSTGVITSHGGGRIEITVQELMRTSEKYPNDSPGFKKPPFIMKELEVVKLTFDELGTLTTYDFLGTLVKPDDPLAFM